MLVSEAAKKLGMNTNTLRLALQQDLFPEFGKAILTTKAEKSSVGKQRYTYVIFPNKLEQYLKGKDYEKNSVDTDIDLSTGGVQL